MSSLKRNNLTSSQSVLGRWKAKPVIYVEGESDKRIFVNYWFTEWLHKVSFDIVSQVQGCTAVVNAVIADRQKGIAAFGIVDRDKLMTDHNWTLLRETSDMAFKAAQPHSYIKVTTRWELESYLIEPSVVESYLAPAQGGRPKRLASEVLGELIDHANALVPFAAFSQALHQHGKAARGDGYTKTNTRQQVEIQINKEHTSTPFGASLWADYQANIPLIDAFSGNTATAPVDKLNGLLRIINGKSMLERIKRAAGIHHDITYHLAKEVKQTRVPDEIESFVRQCCT